MIAPINVPREQFPRSTRTSEGMEILHVTPDNHEMQMLRDIAYVRRGDIQLYLQLILPDASEKKSPLIVFVPGSAFHWQNIPASLPKLCLLANRGYAVASVQYRGSEAAPFPAQILDTQAAVRFLKKHGDTYGYDTEQVWLMGDSSGGHTALMAGITAGSEEWEEPSAGKADASVKGIIDLFGPVHIGKMNEEPSTQDHMVPDSPEGFLIGRKNVAEHPQLVAPTVVTNYITEDREIPPVLIFHGTNDEIVPFGQSCMLFDQLKACHKTAEFYAIEGAHHGGREFWADSVLDVMEAFLARHSSPGREA